MKSKGSTLPNLKNTLQFCQFLLDCSEEDYHQNQEWVRETRQHKYNLKKLLEVLESEDSTMAMMGRRQYENCIKTFGRELAAKIFRDVTIVEQDTKSLTITELLSKMKSGNAASRTKVIKQPNGFFNEESAKGFQDALFSKKSNGYHEGVWPKIATSFAELRQIEAQGELAQQFEMLCQNILQSSEFSPAIKAEKLASLASEYSSLVSGQKGKK